jgi:hypothetical protein
MRTWGYDLIRPLIYIALVGNEPKYRPCRYCGHDMAVASKARVREDGSHLHAAGFRCARCIRHLGWLRASEVSERLLH